MQLTEEQQAVVDAVLDGDAPAVRVEAFAGSGKTTTLLAVARAWLRRRPSARLLYVTFNRRLKDEAALKFRRLEEELGVRGRIDVLTNHGLAYRAVGRAYAGKICGGSLLGRRGAVVERLQSGRPEALRALAALGFGPDDAAVLLLEAVERFTRSDSEEVGPEHFSPVLAAVRPDRFRELVSAAVAAARWLWDLMRDPGVSDIPITHDGYLKVYQLGRPDLSAYELVMFDEAQDANPAMLDVLLRQEGVRRRVFVGDPHQQIYAWRGAVNAMRRLAEWPALSLTRSWRFGPAVADLATRLLRDFKGETRVIVGAPGRPSTVGPLRGRPRAVLTRSNVGALEAILEDYLATGTAPAFVGPIREVACALRAAYRLWQGRPPAHPEFSAFRSWDELEEAVGRYPALASAYGPYIAVLRRYRHEVPDLCDWAERHVPSEDAASDGRTVVSTAHRAKGREWSTVRLGQDFSAVVLVRPDGSVLEDEVNLAYVAVTRAVDGLDPGPLADVIERDRRRVAAFGGDSWWRRLRELFSTFRLTR